MTEVSVVEDDLHDSGCARHDPVPFVDMSWQIAAVDSDVRMGFDRVLASGAFVLGPEVEAFEAEYADYCGVKHCVTVANGTDAIELALRAAGLGFGDEVILPANTFVATAEAVVRAGATPVLVDCDRNYHLAVDQVVDRIGPRTRAVIPVHLYGQLVDIPQLADALPDRVMLIEDAAQSQGATLAGRRSGSLSLAGATSFYPGKNLGAFGDAGAVTTDSDFVAERLRAMRNHGGTSRYRHQMLGVNSRMDSLQAVVLRAKLPLLDTWNALRRDAAQCYTSLLQGTEDVIAPEELHADRHVWHLYVIQVDDRDQVVQGLAARGVSAGIHYPTPIHLLPPFSPLGARGDFPLSERFARQILSLPIFPGITQDQQARVVDALVTTIGDNRTGRAR